MSYTNIKKLPTVQEIIQAHPLSMKNHRKILQDRQEVNAILSGKDKRLLMIIGPCSAWPKDAVLEYADKLCHLNKKVQRNLKIIMRVYIQKPRTTKGWTGPVNQPDPFKEADIEAGIKYTREMMIQVIEKGLPIADEALFTHNAKGFLELLSWVAIGARSSEDQEHRIFASAINCPVGLKNPTHGSLSIAVNSVTAAQHSHTAVLDGYEVKTHGNPFAHVVLRGSYNGANYAVENILELKNRLDQHHAQHPAIIVDASHDNCLINGVKHPEMQPNIISIVLNSIENLPQIKYLVKGFMVESFLKAGNQKINESNPEACDLSGLSITDPCLSWDVTEEMLIHLAKRMEKW